MEIYYPDRGRVSPGERIFSMKREIKGRKLAESAELFAMGYKMGIEDLLEIAEKEHILYQKELDSLKYIADNIKGE